MRFTLALIYIVFYLVIFLAILLLIFSQIPLNLLMNFSISNFMIFLKKYTPTSPLYLWLLFCLTGLPPVGLFLVKFNIFFVILYQVHMFIVILLFLFFFFTMLFYIQVFTVRNFKLPMYYLVTPKIFETWATSNFYKSYMSTYNTYSTVLFVVSILMFLLLTILFFSDYVLVFSILFL